MWPIPEILTTVATEGTSLEILSSTTKLSTERMPNEKKSGISFYDLLPFNQIVLLHYLTDDSTTVYLESYPVYSYCFVNRTTCDTCIILRYLIQSVWLKEPHGAENKTYCLPCTSVWVSKHPCLKIGFVFISSPTFGLALKELKLSSWTGWSVFISKN